MTDLGSEVRGPVKIVLADANLLYSRVLRDYLMAASTSFRCNRQDIVPGCEVICRLDIVPFLFVGLHLTKRGVACVRGETATRGGA